MSGNSEHCRCKAIHSRQHRPLVLPPMYEDASAPNCGAGGSHGTRKFGVSDSQRGACSVAASLVSEKSGQLFWKEMTGTTRLELATSAVTAPSFGNCLKLRGTDGYQNRA